MKASCGRSCLMLGLLLLAWPRPAEPQTPPVIRTTLDTMGQMTYYTSSIAIGSDGRGLVAYYDDVLDNLKVAHCSNDECTAATISTLDSVGDVGQSPSLTIGGDGLGLIAYHDATNSSVKIAHCSNLQCTAAAVRTLDASAAEVSIVTGSDGLGLVGYYNSAAAALKVAHCVDAACTNTVTTPHPGSAGVSSWMVGTDGLALGVGVGNPPGLRAVHCSNIECSAATISTIANAGNARMDAAIQRGTNGLGYVSISTFTLFPPTAGSLAGFCVDVVCSSLTFVPVHYSGRMATGSDGFPLITGGFPNGFPPIITNSLPIVYDCIDAGCTAVNLNRFDVNGHGGASVAVRADSRPLVAYWNFAQGSLKVAHCANPDCRMTGADLGVDFFHGGVPPLGVPGSALDIGATVVNNGPDAAPEATLRFNVPSRLLPQHFTFGGPNCSLGSGEVVCHFKDIPAGGTASGRLMTIVDHGPGEVLSFLATVSGDGTFDVDPANDADSETVGVGASCFMSDVSIVEGDTGTTDAVFTIRRWTSSQFDNFFYDTVDVTAAAGQDYVATSGVLTFAVGQSEAEVRVPIIGDAGVEGDERFQLQIGFPQTCALTNYFVHGTILDDDAPSLTTRELSHGSNEWYAASASRGAAPPTGAYRLRQAPFASYEVVVDGASADITPLAIYRIASDNMTTLQTAPGSGTIASLRWANTTAGTIDHQHVRVVGFACPGACGPDDVYRIRAYETTASIPRFNNAGGQVSVLVLQNPTMETIAGQARFWSPAGSPLAVRPFTLTPLATLVLNTTIVPGLPGASGSVTISNDGPYGALAGKMIALEPATGFSFDSPLAYRPR